MGPLIYIASLVVAILGAAIVLPWDSSIIREPFVRDTSHTESSAPQDMPSYSRRTVFFPSKGVNLEGWLYLPKSTAKKPPVVVMAHGLAGQKDMGLEPFAEVFAARGLAVLLFDYRCFGGSDGEPRNWVSPQRHLQDWEAALDYARSSLGAEVDTSRLGLWGTSYAGGHVLVIAAKEGANVSAVVSMVPFLSGVDAAKAGILREGLPRMARKFFAGLHDRARSAVGLSPGYLAVSGLPGSVAFMEVDAEQLTLYFQKHPTKYRGGWQNRILARAINEMGSYNPIRHVPAVKAPVLLVAATNDTLCPIAIARRAAHINSLVRLSEREAGHFDVYVGSLFEEVSAEQASFFAEALEATTPVLEPA